jgi:hypothetical protein
MLYKKFHETVLNHFGFENFVKANQSAIHQRIPAQNFSSTMTSQNNPPTLPPQTMMSQTHSNLPRRERSLSNESRKREKSVERVPNMMKREVNNSRMNLDANNPSTISNKPKPGQNPSIIPQQQRNPGPPLNQERVNPMQNTQQFVQQQNQQVNVSSASSNFLSQGNSNSAASSRANQQNDPFSSFPQSTLNTRVQQQSQLNVNQ